jgi:hypothetical protein
LFFSAHARGVPTEAESARELLLSELAGRESLSFEEEPDSSFFFFCFCFFF